MVDTQPVPRSDPPRVAASGESTTRQRDPARPEATPAPYDFSLVLGGPLFQLLRRARLAGDAPQILARRVVTLVLLAWLPLLVLSVVEGHAWSPDVKVPFLRDVDVHARFLLALPLFVIAELVVHERTRGVVRQFVERGLIPESERGRFDAAIASAMRLRNSVVAELLLIAVVYVVGIRYSWREEVTSGVATWYGAPDAGRLRLSLAGWWFVFVSQPLVQFIFARWYLRLFIWTRFLWRVSRLELALVPTHPDRTGGLGFLGATAWAFAPLIVGQGVLLAGFLAGKVFVSRLDLETFYWDIGAFVAGTIAIVLAPLCLFAPILSRVRREGLAEYGKLAQRYVSEFDRKWVRGGAPPEEQLVGSADIQSLADLGNSFEGVRSMRLVPFTKETVVQLVVTALLPVAPFALTKLPLTEMLKRFLGVVF